MINKLQKTRWVVCFILMFNFLIKDVLSQNLTYTTKSISNLYINQKSQTDISQSRLKNEDPITVKGKVTDKENNAGLPGVSVVIKGTNVGTTTDAEGVYIINVPTSNSILIFSYIGYTKQEIPVNSKSTIDLSLSPDVASLSEVVVVGYGTQKRTDVTFAVGSVDGGAMAKRGTVNPLQAVQGQIAGVDVSSNSGRAGASYNMQIRGQNSLAGGQPLFVVDGVIVDNINFLNPQDIEKMEVLKDAASTAIYGSRGSNGVVLVTTKKGTNTKGQSTISYSGYYGMREATRMPDFMDGEQWWAFRQNAFISGELINNRPYDATIGGLAQSPTLTQRVADRDYTNWKDLVLRRGIQNNHWLTVSGAGNNSQYLIGAGYQNEKGNLINEAYDRYNLKASFSQKLNDQWSAGTSFNFSLSQMERGSDLAVTNAFWMSPLVKPYDDEGKLIWRPGQIEPSYGLTSSVNPLVDNANSQNNTRETIGIGNLFLQYSPVPWIDIRSTFSPRMSFSRNGRYWGALTEDRASTQKAAAQKVDNQAFSYIWDNMITVKKSIKDHSFTLTGLQSIQKERSEGDSVRVNDLPFNSSFHNLGTSSNRQIASSNFNQMSILSYMVRINYSFRGKYLATISTRWDGSSKLAKGNKWSSFPSIALGWRLSEEGFMTEITPISELKLRASAGMAGNNNNISAYETQMNLNSPSYYDYGGAINLGYAPNRLPNQGLSWEKSREFDLGLDYGLFSGRISGSVDIYNKLSQGLLMKRDLSYETGWDNIKDNVGSVSNKGLELSLRTVNIAKNDFIWTTTFNFARNKNSIVELLGQKVDLPGSSWFIGKPINVNYTYVFDGVWQEGQRDDAKKYNQLPGQARVKDLNSDGTINNLDKAIIGQVDPKWTGGFSSQMSFKGIELSISLFARQGQQVKSPFHEQFTNLADRGRNKLDVDYYMTENTVTGARSSNTYPEPFNIGPYWQSVGYYKNASFVKVQNIQLAYNLPSRILQPVKLKAVRVYANVLNPFVWTKYDGFDPEYAKEKLVDTGVSTITYQFGLNLSF